MPYVVRMQPVRSGFLLGCGLGGGQVRGRAQNDGGSGFVAPGLGQKRPEIRSGVILCTASAFPERSCQFALRADMPVLRRLQKPVTGLVVVLLDSIAIHVTL